MFEHVELVIPPTKYVPDAVNALMRHAMARRHSWCDFYLIGGAWNGLKTTLDLDLEPFKRRLDEMKVTVSRVKWSASRPILKPESQREAIDAEWCKLYPGRGYSCPLFSPYNGPVDINWCRVLELPDGIKAHRLVVGRPYSRRKITHMLDAEHLQAFNNEVKPAIRWIRNTTPKSPEDNWLAVTLCCHW